MFKKLAGYTGYHPFAPQDHPLYPKMQDHYELCQQVPLPSSVQMGSTNR